MMTQAQAITRLKLRGVLDAYPAIAPDTAADILEATVRAAVHAVSTAYDFGDKVIPATANGRVYQCIEGGTTGATAPTWPKNSAARIGQAFDDGTATWKDIGPAHAERYDLNAASRECWLKRAQELAIKTDVSTDGTSIKRSQLYEQAIAQAKRYGWRGAL
jgi:hypothetical protein